MRALTVPGVDWVAAADALDSLIAADVIERALILGWDARELVGVSLAKPHDHPSRAGLIYSIRQGDSVSSVFATGCVIAIAETNLRHIWRRVPLSESTVLPWDLAARAEYNADDAGSCVTLPPGVGRLSIKTSPQKPRRADVETHSESVT